ncbi:MAG: thioredoxin family protein [Armatimonas sp.]
MSVTWAKSYAAAIQNAKASKRLVMIDFYADWCTYCKKMDKDVFPHPRFGNLGNVLVAVKMNSEKEGAKLAQKFKVTGLPTYVFLDPNTGSEVSRISGYVPIDGFVENAIGVFQLHKSLPGLEAKVKANPADTKNALALLKIYARQNRRAKAEALLPTIANADANGKRGFYSTALILMGEVDLEADFSDSARKRFQKALSLSSKPDEKAYSLIRIGICDATQQHLDSAVVSWKKALAVPGCPAQLKEAAQTFIQRAQAIKNQK